MKKALDFYSCILDALGEYILVIDASENIIYANSNFSALLGLPAKNLHGKPISRFISLPQTELGEDFIFEVNHAQLLGRLVIFSTEQPYKMLIAHLLNELEERSSKIPKIKDLMLDMKTIFEASYDVIYVSDGTGKTIRVSDAAKRLWGVPPEDLVGKSVADLEKDGLFYPSATRMAMDKKQKVSIIQKTQTGRTLLVVSNPIFNHSGQLVRIINASKDITEVDQLQKELAGSKDLLKELQKEVIFLRYQQDKAPESFILKSKAMQTINEMIIKIADNNCNVLILGESGVGKGVLARNIHQYSVRRDKPFVKINCGAIPENLLEAELFGYEKGSFTSAIKEKPGLVEIAHGGTLFLDEISELPVHLQVKILDFLQEKTVNRIGSTKKNFFDVRIISATNRDIADMMKKGSFREDLFYRINVLPIHLPPLRERPDDILSLIHHFTEQFNERYAKNVKFSEDSIDTLLTYSWPGNIRELENLLERFIIISSEEKTIAPRELPDYLQAVDMTKAIAVQMILPLKEALQETESQLITMAMRKYKTTTEAAKALGISQSSVSRKFAQINHRITDKR